EVIDRQRGDLGRERPLAQVAPEISGERGQVRDVDLPASGCAAPAARAVEIQWDVAEFAGNVVLAAHELAAEHHADAKAIRHGEIDEVPGCAGIAGGPELCQRARLAGILDL